MEKTNYHFILDVEERKNILEALFDYRFILKKNDVEYDHIDHLIEIFLMNVARN